MANWPNWQAGFNQLRPPMILSKKPAKSGQNRKMVKILPKLVVESGQNDVLLKFHTLKP